MGTYPVAVRFQAGIWISTESFGYADVLSRLIGEHSKPDEDNIIASVQLEADIKSIQTEVVIFFQ